MEKRFLSSEIRNTFSDDAINALVFRKYILLRQERTSKDQL